MSIHKILFLLSCLLPFILLADSISSDTERPKLKGKLVYHSYTSYDALDSQMYLYDFSTNSLNWISENWKSLKHMMNGHFSPDGRYIVLMGISTKHDSWDIFLYDTKKPEQEPVNLTPDGDYRDEDPKWSNSGKYIVFKRSGNLALLNFETKEISMITEGSEEELSMPYFSSDDSKLLFVGGVRESGYIGLYDLVSKEKIKFYDRENIFDYYPINIDSESFYFTTRVSPSDNHDQVYKGYWSGKEAQSIKVNTKTADFSDPYPISNGWLFLVSTRDGGKGGYDLYVANEKSGVLYSLDGYNGHINSNKNELGPCYYIGK